MMRDDVLENPLASTAAPASPKTRVVAKDGHAEDDLEARLVAIEAAVAAGATPVPPEGSSAPTLSIHSTLARLGSAPTSWHQATVFYVTSTDDKDAAMRAKAPMMLSLGFMMVLIQSVATVGITKGMIFPSCMDSTQCSSGNFCYTSPEQRQGRCLFCGESGPLVPYWSEPQAERTGFGPTGYELLWNRIGMFLYVQKGSTGSYTLSSKSDTPIGFAGFNDSHVEQVCTRPFKMVKQWSVELSETTNEYGWRATTSWSGEDVPAGIIPALAPFMPQFDMETDYSAQSVGEWCDSCIAATGDVLASSEYKRIYSQIGKMKATDVACLIICIYVVSLTLIGETGVD